MSSSFLIHGYGAMISTAARIIAATSGTIIGKDNGDFDRVLVNVGSTTPNNTRVQQLP